jgi:HK97 family phage major capsid protein
MGAETDAKMKEYHGHQMQKHKEAARAILSQADAEGRKVTPDEQSEMDAHVARVQEHEAEFDRLTDSENKRKMLESLGSMADIAVQEPTRIEAKSPGDAFTASMEYQAVVQTAKTEGMPEFRMQAVEMLAAVGDPVLEGTGTNATAIVPQWQNFLTTPGLNQFPTVIQEILNIVQLTDGNTAYWPKVTTRNMTDWTDTAESENKSGTDFAFSQASAQLLKWTAFASISEEMFQDADILTNYINTQMGVFALQKEERAIAQALYTGSVTAATGTTVTGAGVTPNRFDKVLEGATMIRVAGGRPNFLLINPYDWARMLTSRDANGVYYSGGPFQAPQEALWGLGVRPVPTPVAPLGTPLLGDSSGCILFRKGGLRTEASNQHADFFRTNLVAIRSEVRSRLGVLYPEFFVELNFGS